MKKVVVLFLIFSLAGCTPAILTRNDVQNIKRGVPTSELQKHIGKVAPRAKYKFNYQNKEYTAAHYSIQTGTKQEMTMTCGPQGCYPIFYTVPVTSPYVFISGGSPEKLIDWGIVEQLSKSSNPLTSGMMPTVKRELEAFGKKK